MNAPKWCLALLLGMSTLAVEPLIAGEPKSAALPLLQGAAHANEVPGEFQKTLRNLRVRRKLRALLPILVLLPLHAGFPTVPWTSPASSEWLLTWVQSGSEEATP